MRTGERPRTKTANELRATNAASSPGIGTWLRSRAAVLIVALTFIVLIGGATFVFGRFERAQRTAVSGETLTSAPVTIAPPDSASAAAPSTEVVASAPAAIDEWLTTDGSQPRLFPDCTGVLGVCLRDRVDAALAILGPEDDQFANPDGSLTRIWRLDGIYVTVMADQAGLVEAVHVALGTDPGARLSLPYGGVLGELRMSDVPALVGGEPLQDVASGEGISLFSYVVNEGTAAEARFTTTMEWEQEPGGFTPEIDTQLVTGFVAAAA